jgi:hypothetical protein
MLGKLITGLVFGCAVAWLTATAYSMMTNAPAPFVLYFGAGVLTALAVIIRL